MFDGATWSCSGIFRPGCEDAGGAQISGKAIAVTPFNTIHDREHGQHCQETFCENALGNSQYSKTIHNSSLLHLALWVAPLTSRLCASPNLMNSMAYISGNSSKALAASAAASLCSRCAPSGIGASGTPARSSGRGDSDARGCDCCGMFTRF